ncbi:M56 family metallopeptidase [Kaistella polysaccharea]|uniref:M56 family metallopeptidase n=1 Tax=Kaistella polysaccharea TaxID=2878534 RepID=UPI001CF5A5C7
MIPIILKIILCSSFLIGLYFLFLERERTFKFNRFFLLTSLIFSYCIPVISIPALFPEKTKGSLIFGETSAVLNPVTSTFSEPRFFENYWLIIYFAISGLLLLKFIYSVFKIRQLRGEKIIYKNQKVIVADHITVPFSFLNTVFLPSKYLKNSQVQLQIFLHEKCHVDQKHSVDLLLLEFLKVFSWFNPALFFYKKAMIGNHEFLADDYVLQNNFDLKNYQKIILYEIEGSQKFNLTHQFNFNNTKKRFIMMTTKNSRLTGIKKFALLLVLALLFLLFTKKIDAQIATEKLPDEKATPKIKKVISPEVDKNLIWKSEQVLPIPPDVPATFDLKTDTIKKRAAKVEDAPVPPPPPPPSEFEQIPAEFPGGITLLRQSVGNQFDTTIFVGDEGLLKTTAYLSIDENGKVTNVIAEGKNKKFNRETERAINSVTKDKIWKPALENGQPVKSVMKMPITMEFSGSSFKK